MASIRYRAGRPKPWIVSYRDDDGNQHHPGFRLEREAKAHRSKVEAALGEGTDRP